MSFEIYPTTAEHVIGAADAALQNQEGVKAKLVANFLDTKEDSALNALRMAHQLTLLDEPKKDLFVVRSPCVKYLCTSNRDQKASVMRFILEQYQPFQIFKVRLDYATGVMGQASTQTGAICGITAHRDVISQTLADLGTYANAIKSQGAGLYLPTDTGQNDYLQIMEGIIADRQATELYLSRRLEQNVVDWIDRATVMENLITAYQRLSLSEEDARAPVVHAANAFESFLTQLGIHYGVNLSGSNGINAKVETLSSAGHINGKHKFMAKYLGHVRNAADHGVDTEIGHQWQVRPQTSIEYVNVTLSMIKNMVDVVKGNYVV